MLRRIRSHTYIGYIGSIAFLCIACGGESMPTDVASGPGLRIVS